MRALGSLAAALLLVAVACGGPTPTASVKPSPAAPVGSPSALPTELVLGQTISAYYDPQVERVVLVNGAAEQGPAKPTELWSWDGNAWELLDASGPEARSFGGVARDPNRGVVVRAGRDFQLGDRVRRDARVGRHRLDGPSGGRRGTRATRRPRACLGLGSEQMLLFGGGSNLELPPETWGWDGSAWTQVADTGPRPGFVSLMTEDHSGDSDVLLHGGHWVEGNDGGFLDRHVALGWQRLGRGAARNRARSRVSTPGRLGRTARRGRHARRGRGRSGHDVQRHVAMARRLDVAGNPDGADPAERAGGGLRFEAPGPRPRRRDRPARWDAAARRVGAGRRRLARGAG